MQRICAAVILIVIAAGFLFRPAHAEERYSFLAKERFSVAAIVGPHWLSESPASGPLVGRHVEWKAGGVAAYNVLSPSATSPHLPHISLNGRALVGLDSKQFDTSLNLVWRIWSGKGDEK